MPRRANIEILDDETGEPISRDEACRRLDHVPQTLRQKLSNWRFNHPGKYRVYLADLASKYPTMTVPVLTALNPHKPHDYKLQRLADLCGVSRTTIERRLQEWERDHSGPIVLEEFRKFAKEDRRLGRAFHPGRTRHKYHD